MRFKPPRKSVYQTDWDISQLLSHFPILNILVTILHNKLFFNCSSACNKKPADIVFLLDSSGSILASDFMKQLNFLRDVVDVLDVSSNQTRVGEYHGHQMTGALGQINTRNN